MSDTEKKFFRSGTRQGDQHFRNDVPIGPGYRSCGAGQDDENAEAHLVEIVDHPGAWSGGPGKIGGKEF